MNLEKTIKEAVGAFLREKLSGNGNECCKETETQEATPHSNVGKTCVVRTCSAGVFVGKITSRRVEGSLVSVTIDECRRIHYWDGAASLSQMATSGVSKPVNCRFSVKTENHEAINVIELIPTTEAAIKNIYGVAEWKK